MADPFAPIALHAFNPGPITGDGNWTWLLTGEVPTLIDAGTGDPRHLAGVEAALAGAPLAQVLVTHGHPDHASGAGALRARWPAARFCKMPWAGQDEKDGVPWIALGDGDSVAAGDVRVTCVHTPGHAPDHLCFWHEPARTLFCGDLAMDKGTIWIPASHEGDLSAYLRSLERIIALGPSRMLPAHGPPINDPDSLLRGYIEHRCQRERQVLSAVLDGEREVDRIVERVYRNLAPPVVPMARESVLSHLVKLERDGRLRHDGEAWLPLD